MQVSAGPTAPINESRAGIYSLLRTYVRKPGWWVDLDATPPTLWADPAQTISLAALDHRARDARYRPPELERYIAKHTSIYADATEDWPGQPRPTSP